MLGENGKMIDSTKVNQSGANAQNDQGANVSDQEQRTQEKSLSVEEQLQDYKTKIERLEASKERILRETQGFKGRAREYEEKYHKATKNTDELMRMKEQENEQLRKENDNLLRQSFERDVREAVGKEARKRNCIHYDQLLALGDTSMIGCDENSGELYGIERFLDHHQNDQNYSHFFNSPQKIPTNNGTPSISDKTNVGLDSYEKNPIAYLANLEKTDYAAYQVKIRELQSQGKLS